MSVEEAGGPTPPDQAPLRSVTGPSDGTWALEVHRARPSDAPVVVGPGTPAPPASVAELLGADALGIGAVVPVVLSPVGQVLEAGAVVTGDGVRRRGTGMTPDRPPVRKRCDVDATTSPWVAVRPEVLLAADLDPALDGPQPVIDALIAASTRLGLRTVVEPGWQVVSDLHRSTEVAPGGPAEADVGSEVLVVTGFVPSDRFRDEDHALQTLLLGLLANTEDVRITLLAIDGYRAEPVAAAALSRLDVEVVHGPLDVAAWLSERCLRFSNVMVTWSGLQSGIRPWLESTQPQAVITLYLTSRPELDIDSLRPYAPADELSGLELVRSQVEERLLGLGGWVDVCWCERDEDALSLRSTGRFPVVSVIPRGVAPWASHSPVSERPPTLLLLATEGHDVVKGNEEAALLGLDRVLAPLRRRLPDLACTVLTENPTPRLQTTCRRLQASTAHLVDAPDVLSSHTLVVVPHQHGTGGATAIRAALEAGAPFLATPQAAAAVELGPLRDHTVCSSVEDLVLRARDLLSDPESLAALRDAVRRFATDQAKEDPRSQGIRTALPAAGLTPTPVLRHRWADAAIPEHSRPPLVLSDLRPAGWAGELDTHGIISDDQDVRYREWVRRYGPTPATLSALEADLVDAEHRPLISVLMPVHDTAAWMLREAVGSLVGQIYPRWQLCIGDDASTRPETLAVLESLAADPMIRIATLPANGGIAAATNAALAMAEGEYVAFLDHDDVLKPHALAQVVRWLNADPSLDVLYSDEDKLDEQGELVQPYLKPNWSPDLLRAFNYVCHLTVIRRSLVEKVGGLRSEFDGSQDHDLLLRVGELTDRISHIPEPLYSWRITPGSAAAIADAKPFAIQASKRALEDSLERRRVAGRVEDLPWTGHFRTRYHRHGDPKVSIVIPTKDRVDLLRRCVESVLGSSTYRNFELVLVDNQTTDGDALGYMASLPARIIHYPHPFNYARMVNLAAASIETDALLFLNNDTEVITPDWIEALLEHAMRPEVGAVGGRLWFGPCRLQHEGIYVGLGGWASNVDHGGLHLLGHQVRNTSAVTGACTMVRPTVYWRVGGNDERLRVAYNDVDICLRIRQAGLEVVYTPYAELFHYESASRSGYEHQEDGPLFGLRWEPRERVDPYYSPLYHRDLYFRIGLGEPERPMA